MTLFSFRAECHPRATAVVLGGLLFLACSIRAYAADAPVPFAAPDTLKTNTLETTVPLDTLYARADRAAEAGSTDAAIHAYTHILDRDSSQTRALRRAAPLYAEQDRFVEAADALRRVRMLDETPSANVIGNEGWYRLLAGQVREARDLSREAREKGSLAEWTLNLAHSYMLERQPKMARHFYRKAMAQMQEGDLPRVLRAFDRFLRLRVSGAWDVPDHRTGTPGTVLASDDDILATKDWFNITFVSEGDDLRTSAGLLPLFGTWLTIVVGLVSLFQQGGEAMTKEGRAAVRNWLLKTNLDGETANWPENFRALFDAVFTERHLSWTCFWRSAVASVVFVSVGLLILPAFGVTTYERLFGTSNNSMIFRAVSLVGGLGVFNIFVDYLSLYQTRWIIGKMAVAKRRIAEWLYLVADALLTVSIPVLFFIVLGLIGKVTKDGLSVLLNAATWQVVITTTLSVVYRGVTDPTFLGTGGYPLRVAFASTFLTSIWLWLYVLSGVALRSAISLLKGVEGFSTVFDVETQPMRSLGLMLAVLVTLGFLAAVPFL